MQTPDLSRRKELTTWVIQYWANYPLDKNCNMRVLGSLYAGAIAFGGQLEASTSLCEIPYPDHTWPKSSEVFRDSPQAVAASSDAADCWRAMWVITLKKTSCVFLYNRTHQNADCFRKCGRWRHPVRTKRVWHVVWAPVGSKGNQVPGDQTSVCTCSRQKLSVIDKTKWVTIEIAY